MSLTHLTQRHGKEAHAVKVFLSGKMDEHGAWRDAIIGRIYDHARKRMSPRWEIVRGMGYRAPIWRDGTAPRATWGDADDAPPPWPEEPNRYVLDLHDYVGPYRVTWDASLEEDESKNLGYFHGSTWNGCHGQMEEGDQAAIVRECMKAIGRADLVFAYLNRPDCFGTLTEIGIAAALGKFVYVVASKDARWDWSDYWFAGSLPGVSLAGFPWREEPLPEGEAVREQFKEALIQWTARPERPQPVALATTGAGSPLTREAAQSFSQIARWSADPRVRAEAERMLRRIAG